MFLFPNKIKKTIKNNNLDRYPIIYLKNNKIINYSLRQYILNILYIKYSINNYNRLKMFCLFTGKNKSIMKLFKISKMCIIENMSQGFITGFYKN
jgi:ribosomal protein S14